MPGFGFLPRPVWEGHVLSQLSIALAAILLGAVPVNAYFTFQLTDSAGRNVVPGEFHTIELLSNGWYHLDNFNPEYPSSPSYNGRLIDGQGKDVTVKLPKDCTLAGLFFLPAKKIKKKDGLSNNMILLVLSPKGFGLFDSEGIPILETVYEHIFRPAVGEPYKFAVCDGRGGRGHYLRFWFDARTSKRSEPAAKTFLTDGLPRQMQVGPVAENRVIMQVNHDEFSTVVFKHESGNYREPIFKQFLKEYKLIGMPRPRLEQLLGYSDLIGRQQKDHVFYWYRQSGMCGNDYSFLEIELHNDKVIRWRIVNHAMEQDKPEAWITANGCIKDALQVQ